MKLTPPRIILITGVGGTGKTTLINGTKKIQGLSQRIDNAVVISKDAIGDRFTQFRGNDYMQTYRNGVYEEVFRLTREHIQKGKTVIVDASHRSQIQKDGWENVYTNIAHETGAILKIVRLVAPVEVLWRRLRRRASSYDTDKDTDTPESLDRWYQENEPIEVKMPRGSLIVRCDKSLEDLIEEVLKYIVEISNKIL